MAIVRFGGGISDARGSAGGTTLTRNPSGPNIRSRVAGVQPRTAAQSIQRASLAGWAKRYSNTLTQAQQAAWRAFAASNPTTNVFGDTMVLSGIAMYTRVNTNAAIAGAAAPIDNPPADQAVNVLTDVNATLTAGSPGTAFLGATGAALTAAERVVYYVTLPMNPGRNFVSSQLRFVGTTPNLNALENFTAAYLAIAGQTPTSAGQKMFVRACIIRNTNGAASPLVQKGVLWS